MFAEFLRHLRVTPICLTQKYPEMREILRNQGNGQGTGNIPTDQECCFAVELQKAGILFLQKSDNVPEVGCYFQYQPNGTQRNIDFLISENGRKTQVDLKHTLGKTFYWNDGWFEPDVLYVISFVVSKTPKVYIGFGEKSCSPEETAAILRRRELIRELNKDGGKIGYLRLYSRQANQYSCDGFTCEFCDERFEEVETRLALNM